MTDDNIQRWAMIDGASGAVTNVCNWDGQLTTWQPPAGIIMALAPDHVGIGWSYDTATASWIEPAASV